MHSLLLTVNNVLYSILSGTRIFMLQDIGQKLSENVTEVREKLQEGVQRKYPRKYHVTFQFIHYILPFKSE